MAKVSARLGREYECEHLATRTQRLVQDDYRARNPSLTAQEMGLLVEYCRLGGDAASRYEMVWFGINMFPGCAEVENLLKVVQDGIAEGSLKLYLEIRIGWLESLLFLGVSGNASRVCKLLRMIDGYFFHGSAVSNRYISSLLLEFS